MKKATNVRGEGDVVVVRRAAKELAGQLGFAAKDAEEVALAVSELATNLVKHAGGGVLTLREVEAENKVGIEAECLDAGPGIPDVEHAFTDGFSTAGSLGYGLGTVLRLTDEVTVESLGERERGTHIVCRRWRRRPSSRAHRCPFVFGAASRAHPRMPINGDAFIIKEWDGAALVGVIDGLGHGQFAHRASQTARRQVETHYDQPLEEIFRGVARVCRATRGVVMALARFDWERQRVTLASVGNIEIRTYRTAEPLRFMVRRGVLGIKDAVSPRV